MLCILLVDKFLIENQMSKKEGERGRRKRKEKAGYNYPEDCEWRGIYQFCEDMDSSDLVCFI